MLPSLLKPSVLSAVIPAVIVVVALVLILRRMSAKRADLRRLVTLLRATDPPTRVQTLDRTQSLASGERRAVGRMLRRELAASARAGNSPPQQAITVWFIRQVVALLADARANVRSDAARLLGSVMGGGVSQLAAEAGGTVALAPAVAAAVELAGGRALAQSDQMVSETRVLALAEMLEAGLRPLAVGLRALQGMEEETLAPALASALRDRSPRVRQSLVEVLGAMGGEKSINLLVPLLQDPSADLRAQAVRALGNLKAAGTASQVAQLLRDPAGEVRAAAAAALAEIDAKTLCTAVLDALGEESRRDDPSESARAAMIEAIVRLSDGGLPALGRAFGKLPRPIARRLATALEERGTLEIWLGREWKGLEDLIASLLASVAELGVLRSLLEALDSTQEWVRLLAAAALGHSRDPIALTATANLLTDPDAEVRRQAVKSIARRTDALALRPLAAAASDPDATVRLAAAAGMRDTLAQRGTWRADLLPDDFDLPATLTESQRALLNAARDLDREVRAAAAGGLGHFGSLEAASALVDLALQDEEAISREAAAAAFALCSFPQKQRLLASALEDSDAARRARAVAILSDAGGAESAGQLIGALNDPAGEVRRAALGALARLDVSRVSEELVRHLKSSDALVRAGIAHHLGRGRSTAAVEALVQALADPEEEVRVNALESLGGMGRMVRRHQSALMARRSDPSPRVREAAGAALNQLRSSWSEAAEAADLFRQGPLSPAAAAAVVDMAAAGDLDLLLRSAGNQQSDQAIVTHLAGAGHGRLPAVLAALRKAPEQDQARMASAFAAALRRWGDADETPSTGPAGRPALPGATDAFLAQLKALDSDVRLMAVEIAGRLGSAESVEALIDVLHRDPVADVRSRAASALAETPVQAAEEALRRALREDPNNIVRRVAGRALDRGPLESARGEQEPSAAESATGTAGEAAAGRPVEPTTIFAEPAEAGGTAEPARGG
jgi:HEAT repeat protein